MSSVRAGVRGRIGRLLAGSAPVAEPALLLAGLGAAAAVRVGMAPRNPAASLPAGAVFAAILWLLAAATGRLRLRLPSFTSVMTGTLGAAVLLAGPLLGVAAGVRPLAHPGGDELAAWAAVVILVAVGEELLLRGALDAAVERAAGGGAAVAVAAAAFALLHVPLYGWGAVPLDLAVGVWLGGLRRASGGAGAPALAHALADLGGWWLR